MVPTDRGLSGQVRYTGVRTKMFLPAEGIWAQTTKMAIERQLAVLLGF